MDLKKIKYVGFSDEMTIKLVASEALEAMKTIVNTSLSMRYKIEQSENPDYVVVSDFGIFSGTKYDGVRILLTSDHFVPDFNVFDYAIGPDQINCMDDEGYDRYFYLSQSDFNKQNQEYQKQVFEDLRRFLFHVFDQNPENAKRRLGAYHAGYHEKYLNEYRQLRQSVLYPIVHNILR